MEMRKLALTKRATASMVYFRIQTFGELYCSGAEKPEGNCCRGDLIVNSVNCWTASLDRNQSKPAVGVYSSAMAEGMLTRQSFGMVILCAV